MEFIILLQEVSEHILTKFTPLVPTVRFTFTPILNVVFVVNIYKLCYTFQISNHSCSKHNSTSSNEETAGLLLRHSDGLQTGHRAGIL